MTRKVGGGGGGGCCGLAIVSFYLYAVRGDLDPCGGEGAQHFAQRAEAQLLPQRQPLEN